MVLLEEFYISPCCGWSMGYTSYSFGPYGLFVIDWRGSEGYERYSDWPGRDRNHWRRVDFVS
jgi:hypothetical protein